MEMNPQDMTSLVLEPRISWSNPLRDEFDLFEVKTGVKHKAQMNHMRKPGAILQPKAACDVWNPTVKTTLTNSSVTVEPYEVNGQQCTSEFEEAIGANIMGAGTDTLNFNTPELQALVSSLTRLTGEALNDSIAQTLWFSDVNFNTGNDNWGLADLSHLDPAEAANLEVMLKNQSCGWDEIVDYCDSGQIPYIDSNDGNANGNATLEANVTDFFEDMIAAAHPSLRYFRETEARNPGTGNPIKGVFLVQGGIFKAYKNYLKNLGTEIANILITNGTRVPNVLMYDDYMVLRMTDWDLFDYYTGRMNSTSNESNYQRAIFTVPRNLTVACDVDNVNIPGIENAGFLIQQSPVLSDKGALLMYYAIRLGMSFAHEHLMVASFNSSTTYATA